MLLFLVAGGVNTLASLAVFQVATALSHRPAAALAFSYLLGAGVTYVTGSRVVFADHHGPSAPRFLGGVLGVLALNLLLQAGLRRAGVDPRLSQVGLAPVMAGASYLVQRRLLFHRRRALPVEDQPRAADERSFARQGASPAPIPCAEPPPRQGASEKAPGRPLAAEEEAACST